MSDVLASSNQKPSHNITSQSRRVRTFKATSHKEHMISVLCISQETKKPTSDTLHLTLNFRNFISVDISAKVVMAQAQQQEKGQAEDRITAVSSYPLLSSIKNFYDNRAAKYDSEADTKGFHRALANDFISWTLPYLPFSTTASTATNSSSAEKKPIRMLDLCCGTGLISVSAVSALGASNLTIDGIDISRNSLSIARTQLAAVDAQASFLEGSAVDLSQLDLRKGSYDLITCCSAMVLLPAPYAPVVAAWSEYLAPGGVLIFDVPATGTQTPRVLFGQALAPFGVPAIGMDEFFDDAVAEVTRVIAAADAGLRAEKVFETPVYSTTEFEKTAWEENWKRMCGIGIPDLGHLSENEMQLAKEKFEKLWLERAEEDGGVIRNETKLVVGIAVKVVQG